MNTQPNQHGNIDVRMRTLRILWIALFLTVVMYYVFTLFARRSEDLTTNSTMSLTLLFVGISTVLVSFLIKSKLLARAVDQQQGQLVQQAYIVAWAMAEVPAMLGLLDFFMTSNPHYYLLMIVAAAGQLLQYPRREHVEQAAFNRSTF